jgi:hypothetical protein
MERRREGFSWLQTFGSFAIGPVNSRRLIQVIRIHPAAYARSAYEQLVRHAIDGKLTVDLERTPLDDIGETWEHLKARLPRKLVVTA